MADPYITLGVSETASDAEIKSAYRRLAKRYHPDVNKSDVAAEMTARINAAYDILSDPVKKAAYDNRYSFSEIVVEEDPVEVYKREFKKRKADEARKKSQEKHARQARAYAFYRWCCYPIAVFSFLVILDYFLPAERVVEVPIEGYQVVRGGSGLRHSGSRSVWSYIETTQHHVRVPNFVHLNYDYYADEKKPLLLEFTSVFGTFKRIGVAQGDVFLMYSSQTFVYFPLAFPLPYLIIGLCIFFIRRKDYTPIVFSFVKMPMAFSLMMLVAFWVG